MGLGAHVQWVLEHASDGAWRVKNTTSGLFLGLADDGRPENGCRVVASFSPAEWEIMPDQEVGICMRCVCDLSLLASYMRLFSTGCGARDADNTKWFGGGRLQLKGSNLCLDLSDHGNPQEGTPVQLWEKWDGVNQVWKFDEGACLSSSCVFVADLTHTTSTV